MSGLRLVVELIFRRYGWMPLAGISAVVVAAWFMFSATQGVRKSIKNQAKTLVAFPKEALPSDKASEPLGSSDRYSEFQSLLLPSARYPEVLRVMFAEAEKNGLLLKEAEYRWDKDSSGEYTAYRIALPVKGPYSSIRQFSSGCLEALHAAALENISFRRKAINTPMVEARLNFVIYLKEND